MSDKYVFKLSPFYFDILIDIIMDISFLNWTVVFGRGSHLVFPALINRNILIIAFNFDQLLFVL